MSTTSIKHIIISKGCTVSHHNLESYNKTQSIVEDTEDSIIIDSRLSCGIEYVHSPDLLIASSISKNQLE